MKTIAILGALLAPLTIYAQSEPADTIVSHELNEVAIEADRMNMTVDKVSYLPTKQQRNASANGTMLLQQIEIPQLIVNSLTGSVSTNAGEAVSFFIDGVPASEADVADMNTRDVLRVEVLDYPTDPKFRNCAHVVNYVMQKYEYGGYTKFNTTEMFMSGFSTYNTLNSKMVYKKMTFDARAYYQYTRGSHFGADQVQHYRLPGYETVAPDGITRTTRLEDSRYTANRPSTSLRALYQGSNTQLSSTLNWSFEHTPTNRHISSLNCTPPLFAGESSINDTPSRKNSVRWSNEFFQQLPSDWALSASFDLAYDHVNQRQMYYEGNLAIRDLTAKEDIWGTGSEIAVSKQINQMHKLSLSASAITYKSDIHYNGSTTNVNHNSHLLVYPGVSYTFTPDDRIHANLGLAATYYHARTAGETESKLYPTVNFNLNWMPAPRHRLGALCYYTINTPSGSQTNSVLLQTDQLRWTQGNPSLHAYHTLLTQLSYTYNPTSYINLSPIVTWVRKHDYFADNYRITDDGKGILVMPENCGNYDNLWASINLTAYALSRKLVIQARPCISYHRFSGEFNQSHTSLVATLSATYYFGQFYAAASYDLPETRFDQANPVKIKQRSKFWLMAGWGNSSWTVTAFLINPFRSHWRGDVTAIDTPWYTSRTTAINLNNHRRLNLTVAYTFGYGKKVQRGNDITAAQGSASSIR